MKETSSLLSISKILLKKDSRYDVPTLCFEREIPKLGVGSLFDIYLTPSNVLIHDGLNWKVLVKKPENITSKVLPPNDRLPCTQAGKIMNSNAQCPRSSPSETAELKVHFLSQQAPVF